MGLGLLRSRERERLGEKGWRASPPAGLGVVFPPQLAGTPVATRAIRLVTPSGERVVGFPLAHALDYGRAIFIAVFVGLSGSLFAQAPATGRSLRFTVFAAKPIADVSFAPRPNAAPQKLQFQPTARSPRYEYRGAMPLRFVDPAGVVVAEASIPPTMRDALLLFTPAEASGGGGAGLRYKISVLDDAAARHGAGGLAIINLSGLTLSGSVNAEKVTLKPGLNPTLPIGRSAKVTFTTTARNKTYQSYVSTVTLGRNERALLILFPPFYKGAFEVQSRLLLDQPPAPPAVVR
jgi:hypothetical protein